MMKQYVKQKIKHKIKLYLTHVSVRRMKEQHDETKRLVKQRKKEIRNSCSYDSLFSILYNTFIENHADWTIYFENINEEYMKVLGNGFGENYFIRNYKRCCTR